MEREAETKAALLAVVRDVQNIDMSYMEASGTDDDAVLIVCLAFATSLNVLGQHPST